MAASASFYHLLALPLCAISSSLCVALDPIARRDNRVHVRPQRGGSKADMEDDARGGNSTNYRRRFRLPHGIPFPQR